MAKPTIKQYVWKTAAAKRVPINGTFELTSRCNFQCRMCYIHMTEEQQRKAGYELTTKQWLTIGRQAVDAGMVYLLLTGGEPMIRRDFTEIYTEMVRMGVMVSVNTNASCVTSDIIDCFRKYPPEMVNVTLYGSSEETYRNLCCCSAGYQKTLQGISDLQQAGIPLTLNTTFTRMNIQDMEKIVSFAKEHKLPVRTAVYVFPKVRNGMEEQTVSLSPEEHGELTAKFDTLTLSEAQILRRRNRIQKCLCTDNRVNENPVRKSSSCMAGRGSFWVCWDGKVYPCGMLPDERFNAAETDFSVCWSAISERMPQVYLPEECSVCAYSSLCPSCAALTQSLHGDTAVKPEEMCRYIKSYSQMFLALTEGGGVSEDTGSASEPEEIDTCVL